MWSIELASSWARLNAVCGSHALTESEPLITTALAISPQRPTVARAGCVAEARFNNEQIARSLDGLLSLVSFSAFATEIFPELQADIIERVNLLRSAKVGPTFSHGTRPEFKRFASRLRHGALAFLDSGHLNSGRLGELRVNFHERYDAVSASRAVAPLVYPHPALSSLFAPPLLVLLAIPRLLSYAGCACVGGC
jgi:hypothetical protein